MLHNTMYKPVCMRRYFLYFRKLELEPIICPGGTDIRYLREVSPKLCIVYFEWTVHVITRCSWHKSLNLLSCYMHFHSCCLSFLRHVSIKLCDNIIYNIVVTDSLLHNEISSMKGPRSLVSCIDCMETQVGHFFRISWIFRRL